MPSHLATIAILLAAGIASPSLADGLGRGLDGKLAPGLAMPEMDAAKGRLLFGSKGCVVCHSINGIGGEDARAFGAEYMDDPMNPFDFAAAMWRGAEPMVMMQQEELGGQIEVTGDELASIIAFVHDADEQKKFSDRDIPCLVARAGRLTWQALFHRWQSAVFDCRRQFFGIDRAVLAGVQRVVILLCQIGIFGLHFS